MSLASVEAPPVGAWQRFSRLVGRFEDGAIVRAVFFAMLVGTAGVLWVDYRELSADARRKPRHSDSSRSCRPSIRTVPDAPAGPDVTTDPALLKPR